MAQRVAQTRVSRGLWAALYLLLALVLLSPKTAAAWQVRIDGPSKSGSGDSARDVVLDPSGDVFVCNAVPRS